MSINERRICDRATSTKAPSFYKLLASFDFIANLVLSISILDLTLSVTELSQGKEIDLADFKIAILSKRNTVDEFHYNCYRIILENANKVSIDETKPCAAIFPKNRNNVPSESVSDYFKRVVTILLLNLY